MIRTPKISAIIVTYNYGRFIKDSIESIFQQKYQELEVIVIDDGSTDNTEEIIRQYPAVIYVKQPHQGIASARNLGITTAKGDYIAFLDADDRWCENKLQAQVDLFQQYPEMEIIFGLYENYLENDNLLENSRARMAYALNVKESLITGLIKKSTYEKVGLFKDKLLYGEDTDWFMRCKLKRIKMHYTDLVVANRRLHGNNTSIVSERKKDDCKILLADILRDKINAAKK